ncbi:MAG: hypothetical protein JXR83_18175, partial [Deltaproteobacteria bacterium]|nr:hypothetical protein [Deltaproteobacteria bacterium]
MRGAKWWSLVVVVCCLACPAKNPGAGDAGGNGIGPVVKVDLHGSVQKGPFVIGSSIEVSLLDGTLAPTGAVYNTSTINDRGEFDISFEAGGPVALQGVGYYYNEVIGGLSQSQLTLRAFYVPAAPGAQSAYVNIITQLTTERIKSLVSGGTAFAEAVTQAEGELLNELAITYPGFAPGVRGIDMNVAGGDTDSNAYLLGVSTVLTQVAVNRGGTSIDANVQELLNSMSIDMNNGNLGSELKAQIQTALLQIDTVQVETALAARLAQIGSSEAVPDMDRVLDQDRDGIANIDDNCPKHENPGQENADGDAYGDVCDDCPSTACTDRCVLADSQAGRPDDICYTACREDADCGSDFCVLAPVGVGLEMLFMCAAACDPLAPACGSDLACFWLAGGGDRQGGFRWGCVAPELHGDGAAGDPCQNDNQICGAGLSCGVQPDFSFYACRVICDPANPTNCDGRDCVTVTSSTGQTPTGIGLCALPPGEVGDPCALADQSTCADGLLCAFNSEQGERENAVCVEAGAAGQMCLRDYTCDDDTLVCALHGTGCDFPVQFPEIRCCVVGRTEGESCDPQGQPCIASLRCNTNSALCPGGAQSCCIAPLAEGAECYNMQICAAGLACADNRFVACPNHQGSCCVQTGGEGQPCNQPDNTCDSAGLTCVGGGMYNVCYLTSSLCDNGTCADSSKVCVQGVCIDWGGDRQPCGASQTCDEGFRCVGPAMEFGCPDFFPECCIAAGGEGQLCLADGTCNDASLVCNPYSQSCTMGNPGHMEGCCVAGKTEGETCDQQNPCLQSLGCAPSGTCAGNPYQCCIARPGLGEECYNTQLCQSGLVCAGTSLAGCASGIAFCCTTPGGAGQPCNLDNTCNDSGLACIGGICMNTIGACGTSDSCADGYVCVQNFCIESGGANQPCNVDSTCDVADLLCLSDPMSCGDGTYLMNCCAPWGGEYEVCGTNRACDSGLVCAWGGSVCTGSRNECCLPAGGLGEACNADQTCDTADLACASGEHYDCAGDLNQCCQPWGGEGEPCGTNQACDEGLGCHDGQMHPGVCPHDNMWCCGPAGAEGEICRSDRTCDDSTLACIQNMNSVCADLMMHEYCCVLARALGEQCDTNTQPCQPGLACVHTGSCVGGESCCITAPALGENCYNTQICPSGAVCASTTVAGCEPGIGYCCAESGAAGQPCNVDNTCDDGSLVCLAGLCRLTAGSCTTTCATPGYACVQGHCIESGGANQPCNTDDSCDSADLLCVDDMSMCGGVSMGFQSCCVDWGDEFEYCGTGGACNAGYTCSNASGVCPNNYHQCCVPSGGLGEACPSSGSCDTADLVCGGNQSYACRYGLYQCCQPWGALGEPCGPGDACDPDLGCVNASSNPGVCASGLSQCCGPAGAEGQICNSDGTCDQSALVCAQNMNMRCAGLMFHEYCCVLGQELGAPCDREYPCQTGLACAATGSCPG